MEEKKKTISLDAAKDIYEELKGKTVQCLVNNEDGDLANGNGVVCGYKDKYLIVGFTTEYEGCIKSFTDNGVFLENRDSLSYRFWNMSHINERLVTKPFNFELAKAGKPVCTRDGREARIICFDRRGKYPIVVLVKEGEEESLFNYNNDGYFNGEDVVSDYDLMMLPEKHEGWLNVYRHSTPIYDSEEKAMSCIGSEKRNEYVATVKVEWEE